MTLRARVAWLMFTIALSACTDPVSVDPESLDDPEVAIDAGTMGDHAAPLAVDDVYEMTGTAATIMIPAATGVLHNDVLHSGRIIGFGPVAGAMQVMGTTFKTAAGGSVELTADGAVRYTPPATLSATGRDEFSYTLQNGSGSATATVTLILGCGSETCNGCCRADGTCAAGSSDDACGAGGEACAVCSDVGNHCEAAVCVNTEIAANGFVADTSVHLRSADEGTRIRRDLTRAIWGDDGFPFELLPSALEQDVASPMGTLPGVRRIDRLSITLDHAVTSIAYVFRPVYDEHRLVIWQQGHSHELRYGNGTTVVQRLLARGYTVVTLWMPLYGENSTPALSHDALMLTTTTKGSPMRLFLEPAIAIVNWATRSNDFDDVAMIGLSGGGWTTTLVAALDARITRSVPVAGSLPLYMRGPLDRGDAEQYLPSIYRIAGYLDLYALGALEAGRSQLQVLNRSDNCCFSAGVRAETYAPLVRSALARFDDSGRWQLFVDDSQDDHRVSTAALDNRILHYLDVGEEVQ